MVLALLLGGAVAAFLGWQALQAASVIVHILALTGGIGAAVSTFVALQRNKPLTEFLDIDLSSEFELVTYIFVSVPVFFLSWKFIESLIATASLSVALIAVLSVVALPFIGVSGVIAVFQFIVGLIAALADAIRGA